jgi:hypothetical protein
VSRQDLVQAQQHHIDSRRFAAIVKVFHGTNHVPLEVHRRQIAEQTERFVEHAEGDKGGQLQTLQAHGDRPRNVPHESTPICQQVAPRLLDFGASDSDCGSSVGELFVAKRVPIRERQ